MQVTTVIKICLKNGTKNVEPVKVFTDESMASIFCSANNTGQSDHYYLYYTLDVE